MHVVAWRLKEGERVVEFEPGPDDECDQGMVNPKNLTSIAVGPCCCSPPLPPANPSPPTHTHTRTTLPSPDPGSLWCVLLQAGPHSTIRRAAGLTDMRPPLEGGELEIAFSVGIRIRLASSA